MPRSHTPRDVASKPAAVRRTAAPTRRPGNRAIGRLMQRMRGLADDPPAVGGLLVRPPDDHFEREAHAHADRADGRRRGAPPRFAGAPGRASGGRPLDGETSRAIQAARGGGRRLPDRVRRTLEPELGVDLSPIRVQSDARAHALTRSVGARAMTVGRTIWIGEGGFSPDTRSGRELLHDEVTHALQQSGVRRVPGRARRQMGQPAAPVVQCLMTAAQLRTFGGPAGASLRGKKRYQKILDKLDDYHAARSATVRRRRLGKILRLVDDFIDAHGSSSDAVKKRKLAAVKDLRDQVLFERGERATTSDDETTLRARAGVAGAGRAAVPGVEADTRYLFTMHSHIGHDRYTAFAKTRAGLRRDALIRAKLGKKTKTGEIMKRDAATTVADAYTDDWKLETDDSFTQKSKRRAYIDDLVSKSGEVGHAWVSFQTEGADGEKSEPLSFGFWPLRATTGFGVDTPGNVKHPDDKYLGKAKTRARTETVSHRRWKRGLDTCYAVLESPPMYNLSGTNCTTFTRDIARAVGVSFPSAYWVAPNLSWVWNPNDLYDTFED